MQWFMTTGLSTKSNGALLQMSGIHRLRFNNSVQNHCGCDGDEAFLLGAVSLQCLLVCAYKPVRVDFQRNHNKTSKKQNNIRQVGS